MSPSTHFPPKCPPVIGVPMSSESDIGRHSIRVRVRVRVGIRVRVRTSARVEVVVGFVVGVGVGVGVRVRYATLQDIAGTESWLEIDRYVVLHFRVRVTVRAIFGSQSRSGG